MVLWVAVGLALASSLSGAVLIKTERRSEPPMTTGEIGAEHSPS
jgi:hypothetical protein